MIFNTLVHNPLNEKFTYFKKWDQEEAFIGHLDVGRNVVKWVKEFQKFYFTILLRKEVEHNF